MLKKKKSVSNFETSSQYYFKDINKFKPLSREEEYSLWEQYKLHNDLSAREKIITSNLKFVPTVAKKYIGLGLSFSDLIAEGNIGFLKALETFDYTKGYKTISYAVHYINAVILDALKKRQGVTGDDLPLDFEEQYNDEGNSVQSDIDYYISNDSIYDDIFQKEEKESLNNLMNVLNKRERFIINNYFGINTEELTLEDIGERIGLTKERVRQLKEKALQKLRIEALNNSITSSIYN